MEFTYNDIIDLPHYSLRYHKPMDMNDRAGQFAAFDALNSADDEDDEESTADTAIADDD